MGNLTTSPPGFGLSRAFSYAGHAMRVIAPWLPRLRDNHPLDEIVVDGITARIYRALPDINLSSQLSSQWHDLQTRSAATTAFQSPFWNTPILDASERLRMLRLITAHEGDRLVGILPLESSSSGSLQQPGSMMSDYLDPLIDPRAESRAWRAILRSLRSKTFAGVDAIALQNLSPESTCPAVLEAICRDEHFTLSTEEHDISARIALAPTFDAYLARLDGHERKELRRKLKKAETIGNAKLQIVDDDDEPRIVAELNALFEMMELTPGGKSRKARWMFRSHFEQCAAALARTKQLRVYKLLIGDAHAAGMIAFPCRTHEILWCGAFNPAMKTWSPGMVLFAMLLRHGIEQKHTHLDLLRGQHDYKYRLGAVDQPLKRLTLRPM